MDETGEQVDGSSCPQGAIPISIATCDQGSCEWVASPWSDCTEVCGGGMQLRNLECRNGGGSGKRVIDGNCYSGSKPIIEQRCNTAACDPLFWTLSPWSACSVQCGGGTMTRTVGCSAHCSTDSTGYCGPENSGSIISLATDVCAFLGPLPESVQICNTSPCAETMYEVAIFDSRKLVSGAPRSDHYAPGETRFFTFQRPNAGAHGICVVAAPSAAIAPGCTTQSERAVAACFNSMRGCISAANADEALAASSTGESATPKRTSIDLWNSYDAPYSTATGTCACFAAAASCIARSVCSSDVSSISLANLGQTCSWASGCAVTGACAIPNASTVTAPSPANHAMLAVFVSRYNEALLGANPFAPPVSSTLADWASEGHAPGEQRLVVWSTDDGFDDAADTVLIGVQSLKSDVNIELTVTALSAFPITYGGTLAAVGGVSAAAIRNGGLTLTVSLSCDAFVDPGTA